MMFRLFSLLSVIPIGVAAMLPSSSAVVTPPVSSASYSPAMFQVADTKPVDTVKGTNQASYVASPLLANTYRANSCPCTCPNCTGGPNCPCGGNCGCADCNCGSSQYVKDTANTTNAPVVYRRQGILRRIINRRNSGSQASGCSSCGSRGAWRSSSCPSCGN